VSKSSPDKRYTQRQVTEIFCTQLGITTDPKEFKNLWWQNPTDPHSLRLSYYGYKMVKKMLKLTTWEFDLPSTLTMGQLLQLERTFQGVYFLVNRKDHSKIVLLDEQEAVMLTLYANDLPGYLKNLQQNL
jgi:hypothetical protein